MTTAKEQFRNDLHKDPEDLEREADGVRTDLEGKVDQLMRQLSPSQLLNQGISFFQKQWLLRLRPQYGHQTGKQSDSNGVCGGGAGLADDSLPATVDAR